jgi:hypothetical protein
LAKRDRLIQPTPEQIKKVSTGTKIHYQLTLLKSDKIKYRIRHKPKLSRCENRLYYNLLAF